MALRGVRSSWDTRGEELVFRSIEHFGFVARLLFLPQQHGSLLFQAPSLADVTRHLGSADDTARGISDRRDGDRHVEESTILGNSYGLEVIDTLTSPDAREHPILFGSPIGGNDQRDVSSDRFLGRPSKNSLRRRIPGRDDAVEGLADDDVVGGLHDRGQSPRRQFVFSPFRDVARDLRGTHDVTVGIPDGRDGNGHVDASTVLGDSNRFEVIDALPAPETREHLVFFRSSILRNDERNVAADSLVGGPAEGAFRRWILGCDEALEGLTDNDVVR